MLAAAMRVLREGLLTNSAAVRHTDLGVPQQGHCPSIACQREHKEAPPRTGQSGALKASLCMNGIMAFP